MRIEIKDKNNFITMFNKMYPKVNIENINGVTTDSRKVMINDIYIPIKGNNCDGHDFIADAFSKGALVSFSENTTNNSKVIKTKSIVEEIIRICKSWKKLSNTKIIAITGSNGKTTTKDLLYHILNKEFLCSRTLGNFNSTIGLPIAFLNSRLDDDYCILEYGASKPYEIEYLCNIISPDFSYVTNVSFSHLANFESFTQLNETKLYLYLATKHDGKCFINKDFIKIKTDTLKCDYKEYSLNNPSEFKYEYINKKNQLIINNIIIELPPQLVHLKENVLGAYIIADHLGIKNNNIIAAIHSFNLPKGRGNMISYNNFYLLDDSYNANPASVEVAINRLNNLKVKGKKILVLADMLELGKISKIEHQNISTLINNTNIDIIITYGSLSEITQKYISKDKYSKHYNSKNKLKIEINNLICKNDIIYLKGSRGMSLEYIYKEN